MSKALVENLYVLQYPMKSRDTDFEGNEVVNCCVKPISKRVKIDFALDTASKHYDAFKGEQLAIYADGKNPSKGERPTFRSGTMDKQTFLSSLPMDNVDKYIVGILQDGEVHVSQLSGILQMRPSYSYFDKLDKRNKAEKKAENEADIDDEELKQVTVQFSRIENEKMKKARERVNFTEKGVDEPWCEIMFHKKKSTAAELEKQKLFAAKTEMTGHALSLSNQEYFDSLVVSDAIPMEAESLQGTVIPRDTLKNMPLLEQLKVILKDGKVLNFQQIQNYVEDKSITTEKLLRTLPQVGLLVRGNWVVQSEILYPLNTLSNINGVTSELMCRGRDYMLYKLSKGETIERRKMATITQLPPDEVLDILKSIAQLNHQKQWELMLPVDQTFEAKYQELVQRQDMYWQLKEEKFNALECEKSPKRVRKKSTRESR